MDTGCIERVAPRRGGSLLPRELVLARLDHSWSEQLLGPDSLGTLGDSKVCQSRAGKLHIMEPAHSYEISGCEMDLFIGISGGIVRGQ